MNTFIMNKKLLLLTSLSVLALVGVGCVNINFNTTTYPSDEKIGQANDPSAIPFSQVGASVFYSRVGHTEDGSQGFSKFTFENGSGTCFDMGLKDFSLMFDPKLNYFALESNDGSYVDPLTALFDTGEVTFANFPLSSGPADECIIYTEVWQDKTNVICEDVDKNEICKATYDLFAIK